MKILLTMLMLGVVAFATPRYDYTIQDVFEYYNINGNLSVKEDRWSFNEKSGYFKNKKVFFNSYVEDYGKCANTDSCLIKVSFDLPYSNLSRVNMDIEITYKDLISLKNGNLNRNAQLICKGDNKDAFRKCEFLKENKIK